MSKRVDITNKVFGRVKVLEYNGNENEKSKELDVTNEQIKMWGKA